LAESIAVLPQQTEVVVDLAGEAIGVPSRRMRGLDTLSLLLHDRVMVVNTIGFGVLVGCAVLGPLLWPKDPNAQNLADALRPPSWAHPMGTDGFGRDVFARFNEGARISLVVGILVAVAAALAGCVIGLIAGAIGRWTDGVLMRVMDVILAFPPLMLAMAVTVGLGTGIRTATIGIMLACIPWYARLLRSEVLRLRSLPFVEAAAAIGTSRPRILIRHVVPHVIPTILIQAASVFGFAVLTLAALGFVGLGAQIPTPEWGAMITEGLQYTLTGQWWVGVFPGLGLLMAVTAATVLADRMRDLLDPRGEYRRA
jgi:peptide/nickel transport system permease protein